MEVKKLDDYCKLQGKTLLEILLNEYPLFKLGNDDFCPIYNEFDGHIINGVWINRDYKFKATDQDVINKVNVIRADYFGSESNVEIFSRKSFIRLKYKKIVLKNESGKIRHTK